MWRRTRSSNASPTRRPARATLLTNPAPSLGGAIIAQALTDLAEIEQPTAARPAHRLRDATDHNKSLAPVRCAEPRTRA